MSVNPLRKIFWKVGLDIHKYRPIFDQLHFLKEADIKTVLDIGANTGQFVREIREVLPEAQVYSFEPLKDCFDKLNDSNKNDQNFKAFNFALGDSNETVQMHRSSYSPSSSIRKMAQSHKDLYPHTSGESQEMILIKRLDDLKEIDPHSLEKNILVKMDTQGYEDKVIKGGLKFLKSAKFVIVETAFISLYEGQPLFANIYALLTSQGFSYKGGLAWKFDAKNGGVLSEDSLFIKH